jgi:hypothetical protein
VSEFIALTGIAGPTAAQVESALREYAASADGEMQPCDWTGEPDDVLVIAETQPGRVTVSYPAEFVDWDDATAFLSKKLQATAFSFHIHEGELWMYGLFAGGEQVDGFNPLPEFWGPLVSEEREAWKGNPAEIEKRWPGIAAEAVANYLVPWDESVRGSRRAYPDDVYTYKDAWQLHDFLKRLGLKYPFDDRWQPMGKCFLFDVDDA